MSKLSVDVFSTDRAFLAALKLHVYGTFHDSFLTTLMDGRSVLLNEELKLELGRFTARKMNNLFVPENNGARARSSAEFFGFTSHKVREKLMAFHDMGVIEFLGKGLRDAYTYRWKLPVKHWEVCSYMRFRPVTADDPSMNLEIYRIYLERAFNPFTFQDFLEMYRGAHGEEYGATRWGKRKFDKIASSYAYESFLKGRLDKLVEHDLVLEKEGGYAMNERIRDALNHLDLFLNSVQFHPSRDMCRVCPLDTLCQGGSTQKLIKALNQRPAAPSGTSK